jgi:drug/metabolite transporter (DMT)-like permease
LRALLIACYIGTWYCCSIGLTLYNKWLFSIYKFNYPILVTLLHMALKGPLARIAMAMFGLPPVRFGSVGAYLMVCVPVGVATSLDVVLSNSSFQFITVTFYTIIKSSVPVWILLFSFALGLQRPSCALGAIIVVICAGISLASLDDNMRGAWQGIVLCSLASVCAGARWAISQLVMQPSLLAAPKRPSVGRARAHAPRLQWRELPLSRAAAAAAPRAMGMLGRRGGEESKTQLVPGSHPGGDFLEPAASADLRDLAAGHATERSWVQGTAEQRYSESDGDGEDTGAHSPAALEQAAGTCTPTGTYTPPALQRPVVHPVSFLWYMSPWAALTLVPAALSMELMPLLESRWVADRRAFSEVCALAGVGAVIAFVLLLAELLLVRATSGLTLSVAGIFKEVLTIYASIMLLGEELTLTNAAGLAVTLVGVVSYNLLMMRRRMGPGSHGGGSDGGAAGQGDERLGGADVRSADADAAQARHGRERRVASVELAEPGRADSNGTGEKDRLSRSPS